MIGESPKAYPVYLSEQEEKQLQVVRQNYDKLMYVLDALVDKTTRQCIIHLDEQGNIRKVETLRINIIS